MTAVRKAEQAMDSDSAPESADMAKSADAFRTIGEAANELGLKTHVLRFWETKFDNLRPMKRPDGRRYYRPEDMEMLRKLQNLLHVQGLTIRGAVKVLDEEPGAVPASESGAETTMTLPSEEAGASVRDLQEAVREAVDRGDFRQAGAMGETARDRLESLLTDLSKLKSRLDAVRTAA
jgi:DNA-binding transcriptional MerR regulator